MMIDKMLARTLTHRMDPVWHGISRGPLGEQVSTHHALYRRRNSDQDDDILNLVPGSTRAASASCIFVQSIEGYLQFNHPVFRKPPMQFERQKCKRKRRKNLLSYRPLITPSHHTLLLSLARLPRQVRVPITDMLPVVSGREGTHFIPLHVPRLGRVLLGQRLGRVAPQPRLVSVQMD
jgi:hypothetical protein